MTNEPFSAEAYKASRPPMPGRRNLGIAMIRLVARYRGLPLLSLFLITAVTRRGRRLKLLRAGSDAQDVTLHSGHDD